MSQEAYAFACPECKTDVLVTHMTLIENEPYLVGDCPQCKASLRFSVYAMIAGLSNLVFGRPSKTVQ